MLRFESLLKRIKVLNEDGSLSFTNAFQLLLIIRLGVSLAIDAGTLGALLLVLLNANAKRFSRYRVFAAQSAHDQRVEKIESDLLKLNQIVQMSKLGR